MFIKLSNVGLACMVMLIKFMFGGADEGGIGIRGALIILFNDIPLYELVLCVCGCGGAFEKRSFYKQF